MNLSHLKQFLTVVEFGSFSEAALEQNVSQAAISYAIAELEKELGARLFDRGRFGAKVTEIGEKVALHARAILKSEDAIFQEVCANKADITATLRIASFRSAAGRLLPKVLLVLRESYPNITVQLIEVDLLDSQDRTKEQLLSQHIADIAFLENNISDNRLLIWSLLKDPFMAVLPNDDKREIMSWEALENESFIFSECVFCSERLNNQLASLSNNVEPSFRVKEDSTILRMVSQGLGMAVMAQLAIDELPENVKIVPMDSLLERDISIAIAPENLKIPAIRVFLSLLKETYPDSEIPSLNLK